GLRLEGHAGRRTRSATRAAAATDAGILKLGGWAGAGMSLELYRHDLNVLERHCEAVGRDLAEIERVEDEIAKAFDRSGRRYPVGKRAGNSACLPS
ncbi:MAG: hypothetical protein GWO40_00535, partial [Gammaproteobacteria bacterium]|nr:hypothetical protein [Gemmatimonadota bacterium]NIU02796.1 hypothetical protein [Gammaproteobacteria bacterium]NIV50319.1 hypothetical protein [Gammaproteobacteria bacterium]NIX84071.1 hypothetical protein [Gammaproteobacteria bacterium]